MYLIYFNFKVKIVIFYAVIDSNDSMDSNKTDERRELKITILTSKAKHIEDLINAKMDEIEELTRSYDSTIQTLNSIRYTPGQASTIQKLITRMSDDDTVPHSYKECDTAEQMVRKMMHDTNRATDAMLKAAAKKGVEVPSLTNDEDVLARMRIARELETNANDKKQ